MTTKPTGPQRNKPPKTPTPRPPVSVSRTTERVPGQPFVAPRTSRESAERFRRSR